MTLFPSLSDTYYVDNDHNILKMMDYTYSKNIQINQSFWSEADTDTRFKNGDQTLWNDIYGNMPAFRRKQFNFNRIRRVTNMITGYQRQHRKSTIVTPIEGTDELTAEQFTKLMMWANTKGSVLETLSDAFEGAVTTGMNLLSVWVDWRSDPVNGDICVDNVAYNGYLMDPYFKKMDLSDCNSIWTRKYLSKNQCKALLPGRERDIDGLSGWGNRDGKFQFMPESYNYGMQDLIIYDEFWYLDSRKQKMLVDIQSGETLEWRGNDEDLQEFLRVYPQIITLDQEIPTVKLAVVVQGKVMYNGLNPLGIDAYPFVPVWSYYDPQMPSFPYRVQGVVRGLRDAQYLYNRRRIIELDILESQMTSGFIYKEGAPVNPKDVFLAGQGRGLPIKNNFDPNTDVKQIQPPQIPPSMIQLSELLGREIQEISGVSDELLGMADDDKAGILSMVRQGANLTTLQGLFDNLDRSQKLLGSLFLRIMQQNWTPGKVRRILNEEPTQQFYSRAFGKFDCVIEEGLNTSTQRNLQFAQMLQMREILGDLISPEDLLEAAPLQGKKKIIENIKKREEAAQASAQQQQEAQIAVLQAQIEDLKAKAMANEGLGYERASRVSENQALAVERIAEAQKDRDIGTYERIKAAKELTDIDLNHLQRAVEIIKLLQEDQETEAVEKANKSAEKNLAAS